MARLFGLITNKAVDFHLKISKSEKTPTLKIHGWGIGGYDNSGKIRVQKGKRSSLDAQENTPVDVLLKSKIVISHARVATIGLVSEINIHPFYYKNFLFAHNGTVHKEKIQALLKEPYNHSFQSEPIDSELLFRLIIQNSSQTKDLVSAIKQTVEKVKDARGTNFILSDGKKLFSYCFGKPLYFLRRKPSSFSTQSKETGIIFESSDLCATHCFLVCSEKITDENWIRFDDDELVVVDRLLNYETNKLSSVNSQ